jgi:endonuclease/exonuclease/phosphatase family metal-dependent hydrolase
MYLKTYGDISQHPATIEQITELEKITGFYKKNTEQIRLMTYNILADSFGFEGTPSEQRADAVCRIIKGISPDVCGFQEMSRKWFACIYNNTDYKFIHPIRSVVFQTMTTLAYNPETVTLVAFGEQVFKNGSNSPLRRMVWGVFRHKKTDKVFAVVNTHFSLSDSPFTDTTTPLTQALELITLCKDLKNLFNCPIFPLGDFNAHRATKNTPSPIYDILVTAFKNTSALAQTASHGENSTKKTLFIDHIFSFGDATVTHHATLSQSNFRELSDHYPVFCDISIQ